MSFRFAATACSRVQKVAISAAIDLKIVIYSSLSTDQVEQADTRQKTITNTKETNDVKIAA